MARARGGICGVSAWDIFNIKHVWRGSISP